MRQMIQPQRHLRRIDCSICGHFQTRVFAFPKAGLAAERPSRSSLLLEKGNAKATIVTDLVAYFKEQSPFGHYAICSSLRAKVGKALREHALGAHNSEFPIFLVLEQENTCAPPLDDGVCYVEPSTTSGPNVEDKRIAVLNAGRPAWSELAKSDTGFINTVLAAVKVVQDVTETIREVAEASCFYETHGRAVYPNWITASGRIEAFTHLRPAELAEKVAQLRKLVEAFEAKRQKHDILVSNLVDALRLDDIDSDDYRRGWYLCLFEAIKAMLSGGHKQDFHQRHRAYRKTIGHPNPGTKMNMAEFGKLQRDTLAEVKRIFLRQ